MKLEELFNRVDEYGVGRIVKGSNTTKDVGVDHIKKQAAKWGFVVDKDGRAPLLTDQNTILKKILNTPSFGSKFGYDSKGEKHLKETSVTEAEPIAAQKRLQKIYLDWVNNYISLKRFAEVKNMSVEDAKELLRLAKNAHENIVKHTNQTA